MASTSGTVKRTGNMGLKFIDTIDDVTLDAEQKSWAGGADEFQTATLLAPNVGGKLENCIVEDNGRPRNRPGADPLGDAVLDSGQRVQCLAYFDTPSLEFLYASINQSLREWTGASWSTIAAYPFGANTIVDMVQGNNLLYCTSGTGQWYSYSGAVWSSALGNTTADPPNGATILCWHTFRMFAAGAIGSLYDQIYVSDLGAAGAGDWDHTAQAFRVGRGEGERIVSMCSGRANWLFVGKEGSIFAVDTTPTITVANWPIYRLTDGMGVVGRRAMVLAGSSLWVITPDLSLREIIPSTVEDTPFDIGAPASEPAKPYFDRINRAAQSKIVLHKYGRYLLAAVPLDNATEPSHVLVWNLRLRRIDGMPAFIGVWTGWTPTAMGTSRFAGVERFVFGDSAGYVNEWKDYEDQTEDNTYQDNGEEVLATIRSRSWDFGSQRNPKDSESCELQFVNSTATVRALAMFDEEEQARWELGTQEVQNQLPVDLPFDLAVLGPAREAKNMDGLPEFREMYLEVQQTGAGRLELKSMAASAFVNTQENE